TVAGPIIAAIAGSRIPCGRPRMAGLYPWERRDHGAGGTGKVGQHMIVRCIDTLAMSSLSADVN
ncbi:MAG TPA: hypothetical protein VKA75_04530, partial [Reyranella sp.]|nr:hypothetical protein [Reyranella sp.]